VNYSLVITAHNKGHYLDFFLSRVRHQEPQAELVCIDDGSTDNTGAIMKKYADSFAYTDNIWETRANNVALKMCSGDYIAIVQDDDLPFVNNWIHTSVAVMEKMNIHILGGRGRGHWYNRAALEKESLLKSGKISTKNEIISLYWERMDYLDIVRRSGVIQNIDGHVQDTLISGIYGCDITIRSPFIISREAIDHVGMFDEIFAPLTYDDHDFCLRAQSHGYRTAFTYIPQCTRFFGGSKWLNPGSKNYTFMKQASKRNRHILFERHYQGFPEVEQNQGIQSLGQITYQLDRTLINAINNLGNEKGDGANQKAHVLTHSH